MAERPLRGGPPGQAGSPTEGRPPSGRRPRRKPAVKGLPEPGQMADAPREPRKGPIAPPTPAEAAGRAITAAQKGKAKG